MDGNYYEGEYVHDQKHGKGVYHWKDGRKFIGSWVNGKQEGIGIYQLKTGDQKVGEWRQGKRIRWLEQEEIQKNKLMGKFPTVENEN